MGELRELPDELPVVAFREIEGVVFVRSSDYQRALELIIELKAKCKTARCDALHEAAAFIAARADDYPVSVFIPPKSGEHGKTVDGCSAAAARALAKNWSATLRHMAEEDPA